MRRCPECGFRANEQTCPLCGVRMQQTGAPVQTHTHAQSGERCVLPNREPARQNTPQNGRKKSGGTPSGFVIAVVVIVLVSMLRSCVGLI